MPGIIPMACLTIVFTTALCIATLNAFSGHKNRYIWILLIGLPLSFAINRLVKIPLLSWTAHAAGIPLVANLHTPVWFLLVILFNAPVWEEAIKGLPLLLPGLRKFLNDPIDSLWTGLALGMSFGLGEIIYLAYGLAVSPQYSSLPWFIFTGFAGERLIMTFGHGFMAAQVAVGLQKQGWNALYGYLGAVGLHTMTNLGALLSGLKLIDPQIGTLLSYGSVLIAFILFQRKSHSIQRGGADKSLLNEKILFERYSGK